jgi:hypothetical protein
MRRPFGKRNNIKMDLKVIAWEVWDWINLDQNRGQ